MKGSNDEIRKIDDRDGRIKALEREIQILRRKSRMKEFSILLFYFSAVAVFAIPVKAGIDVLLARYLPEKHFFTARVIAYSILSCVFFPIIGCAVSNCYGNLKKIKNVPKCNKAIETIQNRVEENWLKAWWKDFTSEENLTKNFIYYPVIFVVNSVLCITQYLSYIGVKEVFKNVDDHKIEVIIGATAVSVICVAAIATIFSLSLQNLLWGDPKTNVSVQGLPDNRSTQHNATVV